MPPRKASVVTQKPPGTRDALDPAEFAQTGALAANQRDLRLVNLLEIQHVANDPQQTTSGLPTRAR